MKKIKAFSCFMVKAAFLSRSWIQKQLQDTCKAIKKEKKKERKERSNYKDFSFLLIFILDEASFNGSIVCGWDF